MKVVILAGGLGTRISEESGFRPKPMVEIGTYPILWHIMKIYSHYGFNDFVICCGYKGYMIKEYFANYYLRGSNITFDFSAENKTVIHSNAVEPWRVTLVDTGADTMTGGRILRIKDYVEGERFLLSYGDGLSNVDIPKVIEYHNSRRALATITAVNMVQRFGVIDIDTDGIVTSFREKKDLDGNFINGGYMVLEPEIFRYISGDECAFEEEPLSALAGEGRLCAFIHKGFWQAMDTQREKQQLEKLWEEGAPWKIW